MKPHRLLKTFLLLLALFITTAAAANETADMVRYLDYRSLPRISDDPVEMTLPAAVLCKDPTPEFGPHVFCAAMHLYANQAALAAKAKGGDKVRYPIGSLFVKEKFERKEATAPMLITVMEKMSDKGQVEDWKFTMIRLSDRSVVAREHFKISCEDCHAKFSEHDFISSASDSLLSAFLKKQPPVPAVAKR